MGQEKRILVAFALSFAVLMVWRMFFMPPAARTPRPGRPAPLPVSTGPQPVVPSPPPARVAATAGSKAREIVVDGGESYRITLSTEGAVIKSWVLKKYQDAKEQPLDLVDRAACDQLGYPMRLNLSEADLSGKLNGAVYAAKPAVSSLEAPAELDFVYSDGKVQVRKHFSFESGYEVRVEASVFNGERYMPVGVEWPGGFGDHTLSYDEQESRNQAVYGSPENLSRVPRGKVKEDHMIPGPLVLAGVEDRYFVKIFFPGSADQAFSFGRRAWNPPDWKAKDPPRPFVSILGSPAPRPLAFRLFVAPKDVDALRSAKPPLDALMDFGWFTVVAKPLFLALRYIYDHWIQNYGWAIVLLTVCINLALFPLKWKGIRSAQEMQKIAPQVKSIQERYKQYKFNDPRKQRMNQEIMKLYKEHGVNPVGGCLPMLFQMPFLYGFYRVLDLSIELRHAPWILWVKDLSAPDPYYVLPIVMTATMFILQKMTPVATTDPAQQRMMMMMPLIFGFMFLKFACGLVLYWLAGNVVGIAQQVFINRLAPASQPVPLPGKMPPTKG